MTYVTTQKPCSDMFSCRTVDRFSQLIRYQFKAENSNFSLTLFHQKPSPRLCALLLKPYVLLRAMHFSAQRGVGIAYRPSVRPSVTLVDCGWKSWKLIARTIPNTFALSSPNAIYILPWEHGEILGRLGMEWEKMAH